MPYFDFYDILMIYVWTDICVRISYILYLYTGTVYLIISFFVLRKDLGRFVCQKLQKIAGQLAGLVAWGLFLGKPASFHSVSHQIDVRFGQSSQREKSTNKHVFHGVNEAMKGPCVSEMSTFFPEKPLGNNGTSCSSLEGAKIQFPRRINKKSWIFWELTYPTRIFCAWRKKTSPPAAVKRSFPIGWLDDISVQVQLVGVKVGVGKRNMNYQRNWLIGNHCFFQFRKYMKQCVWDVFSS